MSEPEAKDAVIDGEFQEEEMPVTQIVKHEESNLLAPAGSIDELLGRYNLQSEFINKVLKEGTDYGVIPGTEKKTLWKPGAEKITTLFGLSSKFPKELQERVEDWTGENHGGEPFFFYEDTCRLTKDGVLIAEAAGSCNSWEKKYRYRSSDLKCPVCEQAGTVIKGKEEYGGGWLCWARKGGCGAKFADGDPSIEDQERGQVTNPYIFDQVNTIKKMSQKRAYVAAVLMAGNVSDHFTQDVEDSDEVGGNIQQATQREAREKGISAKREKTESGDALHDAKIIVEKTSGKLTPTHYWPMVRKMGIDDDTAADIASAHSDAEDGWREALAQAIRYAEEK